MSNADRKFNMSGNTGGSSPPPSTPEAVRLDDLGAEPLEGSGFEDEDPEPEFQEER
jgi:hypothetical protein